MQFHVLDAATCRWLLPSALVGGVLLILGARWRELVSRRRFTRGPNSVEPPPWQTALGGIGARTAVTRPVATMQVFLLLGVLVGLVLLVCMPVAGERPRFVRPKSLQVVALVDESMSADAEDYKGVLPPNRDEPSGPQGTRMQMAQTLLNNASSDLTGNGFAICVYASQAMMLQPRFVYNHGPLWYEVENFLKAGSVPGGTRSDIAEGLNKSLNFIAEKGDANQEHMVVLLSDGGFSAEQTRTEDKFARLRKQLARLKEMKVKLVIAALGSDSPVPIPLFQRDQHGRRVRVGDLKIGNRTALTSFDAEHVFDFIRREAPDTQYFRIRTPDDFRPDWPSTLGMERMETGAAPISQYVAGLVMLLIVLRILFR